MPRLLARKAAPAVAAAAAVILAGAGVGIAFAVRGTGVSAATTHAPVLVSASACAPGWTPPGSGHSVLTVENTSKSTIYEVDLVSTRTLQVYGEIEMLAPGTEDTMDTVLPPGEYSFECESFSGATLYSRPETVTGPPVAGAHPYTPVEVDQIDDAITAYRASLAPYMQRLERDTDSLLAAVEAGDLQRARARWLPAHLDYERLGAAYDAFGAFDDEIDGRPLGLVGGVHSPKFHGFLRLEYGLWHGQPAPELLPVARLLDKDVHGLAAAFPGMNFPANDLALRAHEILENTLQFEMTAETDEGSNTNLATAWANVQGTELTIDALTPLLHQYDPSLLAVVVPGLHRLQAAFHAYERPNGSWTPLQSLTTSEHEHLDAELSGLLEQLSTIPDLFDLPIRPLGDS